jgi:DNA-binding CsgD family transcriptional regulator/predicted hydrocarbon binding protein
MTKLQKEVLERLVRFIQRLLHPIKFEQTCREIGIEIGREVSESMRSAHPKRDKPTPRDYLQYSEWLRTHLGWEQSMRLESDDRVEVSISACPFVALVENDPTICQTEAAILGSIASDHFGYGKVTIHRNSHTPPRHCRMTVHLQRTPESLTAEGFTFQTHRDGVRHAGPADLDTHVLAKLTQRERQILHLLAEGLSDKQIAEALRLSVRTIEGHLARIREKTALQSRSALIRFALRSTATAP